MSKNIKRIGAKESKGGNKNILNKKKITTNIIKKIIKLRKI